MTDYIVNRTDSTAPSVTVPEFKENSTSLDVSLFGKIRLEYGENLNEDFLNILENFSCPEETNSNPIVPDLTQVSKTQLSNPTIGQFWYNSTKNQVYYWTGTQWNGIAARDDAAANWGQLLHGEQLPKPVSSITGYIYNYDECIWTVAPTVFVGKIGFMNCTTDANATVTMQYRLSGTEEILNGQVNYLIIGLRGANTQSGPFPTPPAPSPTQTVTPTQTITPTPGASPTVTATVTPTVTITITPTITPTLSLTPSITGTPVVTPTSTSTPVSSVTPTPAPSTTPTPSPAPPLSSIVTGGDFSAGATVGEGSCAGGGIGFQPDGTVTKTGFFSDGPNRWIISGYNTSDYEVSFTGNYNANNPSQSSYATPAGSNTMGSPSTWYNLGAGNIGWTCGTCQDTTTLEIFYTIRRVGDSSQTVIGSIGIYTQAGTPT